MGEAPKDSSDDLDAVALTTALTKWLIPSLAVLFGVVGYVVQFAQDSLLGVEIGERAADAYFNSAVEFFRDAAIRLLNLPQALWNDVLLHRPLLLIWTGLAVAAAVICVGSRRMRIRLGRRRAVLLAALALASVVATKFVVMDAPLLSLNNLISTGEGSCWALVRINTEGLTEQKIARSRELGGCAAPPGYLDKAIWRQTTEIYGELVASRVALDVAKELRVDLSGAQALKHSAEDNRLRLDNEFTGNLLIEVLTIGAALFVLRRARHDLGATITCLIVILYGLTAPYAYGKVGMTQLFDAGDARISGALVQSYQNESPALVEQGPEADADEANPGSSRVDSGWVRGVLLHRSSQGVSLLTIRPQTCPGASKRPPQIGRRVSSSFISPSQLLSFDEISKVDLIPWLLLQQRTCPAV